MQHARPRPLCGDITGFFAEFSLGAEQKVFTRVALASRKLDHHLTNRVTKLALKDNLQLTRFIFKQGHDHDRTGMNNVFTTRAGPIRQLHDVTHSVQEMTTKYFLRAQLFFDEVTVTHCRDQR